MKPGESIRTPLARARGLGSAKSGTEHFWNQRLTSVVLVPLTVAAVVIVLALVGRNHATVVQVLGSPLVAVLMLLFIVATTYHMKLGMQHIVEDYFEGKALQISLQIANVFVCVALGLASAFAILKLSFGV